MRWPIALLVAVLAAPAHAAAPAPVPATAADVLRAVRAPGAQAVLVNVWATWCIPCREEIPDLLKLRHAYAGRGLRVLLVSGDFPSEAQQATAFLSQQGVDFPTYIKKGSDMEFIDALDPQWSGALPLTLIYDSDGRLRHSMHGKGSYDEFETQIRNVLHPKEDK